MSDHERKFVRHSTTGDLGEVVVRDGKDVVLRTVAGKELLVGYNPNDWYAEDNHHPMTKMQRAKIAFVADRELCRWLGLMRKARVDWIELTDEQKIEFCEKGPHGTPERVRLWTFINKALEDYAR